MPTPAASFKDTKAETINLNVQLVTPKPKVARKQEDAALQAAKAEATAAQKTVMGSGRHLINELPRRYGPSTRFYGRSTEQDTIQAYIHDQEPLITLLGRAGAGKTALASIVLTTLLDKADWLSGVVSLTAVDARYQISLERILSDFKQLLPDNTLIYETSDSARHKVERLLYALRGGCYVLLLDNLETLLDETEALRDPDLQALFEGVLEQGGLTILTTTRYRPRLDHTLRVHERPVVLDGGLPIDDALIMLRGLDKAGRLPPEDDLLRELIQRVQGFPKALEAAVGLLAASPSLTLSRLLQDEALFTGEVTQHFVKRALEQLPPLYMRVMEALSLFNRPVTLAAVQYLLAPYVDWSTIKAEAVLDSLIDRRFVSYNAETARYSLHPLDSAYCDAQIPEGLPEDAERRIFVNIKVQVGKQSASVTAAPLPYTRYGLNGRAARFFHTQRTPPGRWKTLADVEPQLSEFEYLIKVGEYDSAARLVHELDMEYLLPWGYAGLAVKLHEQLQSKIKDYDLRASHLGNLGNAYHALGDYTKAIAFFNQSAGLARQMGDIAAEWTALGNLGTTYMSLSDYPRALELYTQFLGFARQVGDKRNEGAVLGNLGNIYIALGDYPKSIEVLTQALDIARQIGDESSESIALGTLGTTYQDLGDYPKSIELYTQALDIVRQIGDKSSESILLGSLGNTYNALGDYPKSIELLTQALDIARQIGDKNGESTFQGNLGNTYNALGDYPKSIELLTQALDIARQIGDKSSESIALGNLGYALAETGNYDEGFKAIREALLIAEPLQSPTIKNHMGGCLAHIHLLSGDLSASQTAVEAARQHNAPENNHNTAVLEGVIALRIGKTSAAQTAFQDTLSITQPLLKHHQAKPEILYAHALALAGLALIDNTPLDTARTACEAALARSSAKGVVQAKLRLLEQLAMTANGERLEPLLARLREQL